MGAGARADAAVAILAGPGLDAGVGPGAPGFQLEPVCVELAIPLGELRGRLLELALRGRKVDLLGRKAQVGQHDDLVAVADLHETGTDRKRLLTFALAQAQSPAPHSSQKRNVPGQNAELAHDAGRRDLGRLAREGAALRRHDLHLHPPISASRRLAFSRTSSMFPTMWNARSSAM